MKVKIGIAESNRVVELEIDDVESVCGRIRWAPWQEAQFATVTSPAILFKP